MEHTITQKLVKKAGILGLGVILCCFGIALYRLPDIPGEWYGDISIVHEYVLAILSRQWPFLFVTSAGPLYHYLIAPVVFLFGHAYVVYKVCSVVIGMVGLVGMYLLLYTQFGGSMAVVGTALVGMSSWFLAWERTGNSQVIIIPILMFSLWLFFRWERGGSFSLLLAGFAVSLLGLFVYPQSWMIPVVYVWLLMTAKKRVSSGRWVALWCFVGCASFLWFVAIRNSGDTFVGGYIGSKIWPVFVEQPAQIGGKLLENYRKVMFMFHGIGDGVFRVNVPRSPMLDPVSGIGLLFGLLIWTLADWKQMARWIVVPVMMLVLPSVSPALPAAEIPNSGRTIAILPLVFTVVSYGMCFIGKKFGWIVVGILMCGAISLNLYKYFIVYPTGLPNGNTPTARHIAAYIDTLPLNEPVYLSGCCWEAWGQPEPKAIYYQLNNQKGRETLLSIGVPKNRRSGRVVVISPPDAATGSATRYFSNEGVALFAVTIVPE